ncbi:MAG: hypothetical protein ABSC41_17305 [Acidimicrobiales bacterium]|jgi:glutathione synthase/RimK-type ligase-like ATP-grasp enzyme
MVAPEPPVVFAASEEGADLDDGWPYLRDALIAAGVAPSVAFWDDPTVQWESFALVVSVFVWGYVTRRAQFLAWVDKVDPSAPMVNPAPVLRWNSDKTYLADLAAEGIPIVPTRWVPPGADWEPPSEDYVIKPSVASGGIGAARYRGLPVNVADRHVLRLHEEGYTVMVQPYQSNVDDAGEASLIYIGGHYSHAINKAAMLQADVGVADRLWERQVITSVEPRNEQRTLAETVMRSVHRRFGPTGYGRIDLVDGSDGHPRVLEVELVEPSLFLVHAPEAAIDFANHLYVLAGDWLP